MKIFNNKSWDGFTKFKIVWVGQLMSLLGSAMTRFALLIWAYSQIERASVVALLGFSSMITYVLLSPVAGAIVDRYSRKKIMILADCASGAVTLILLMLLGTGQLRVWHLFVAEALSGASEAFQIPAYLAASTLLVSKDKYARVSGLRSLASNSSRVFAPIIAGILLAFIDIAGIMVIDLVTFGCAMLTLLMVSIPNPVIEQEEPSPENTMWSDIKFGLKYLLNRKGLLYLMGIFAVINLLAAITYYGILPAMVLSRTNNNEMSLALIQSALGVGGVAGSLLVTIWGCPNDRIKTILLATFSSFILGDVLLAIQAPLLVWAGAAFCSAFFIPLIQGAEMAIWQSKVAPQLQGRVFATRSMMQLSTMPIGYLLGGYLADYVFEPAMQTNGYLQYVLSWLVGTGKGSGMAVMFLCTGILGSTTCLIGYFIKELRDVEINLPDY